MSICDKVSCILQGLRKLVNYSLRSEVNKFLGPKARTELSHTNSSEKYIYMYIYIYIDEDVRSVAWQQCKHSLNDVRQREGC